MKTKVLMKYLLWTLGALVGLAALFLLMQTLASERVEVVELHTLDESGEEQTTRLWVVDDEGYAYLRTGADGSGWFSRINNSDYIEVTRDGNRMSYMAVLREDKSAKINELMQSKYTWGDTFFALMTGSREGSIPIELRTLP